MLVRPHASGATCTAGSPAIVAEQQAGSTSHHVCVSRIGSCGSCNRNLRRTLNGKSTVPAAAAARPPPAPDMADRAAPAQSLDGGGGNWLARWRIELREQQCLLARSLARRQTPSRPLSAMSVNSDKSEQVKSARWKQSDGGRKKIAIQPINDEHNRRVSSRSPAALRAGCSSSCHDLRRLFPTACCIWGGANW